MSSSQSVKHASWAYAEQHGGDDDVLEDARRRAEELGIQAVSPGAASALTVLAATTAAHALVEIGTGAGVSGTALLRGAAERAVLTSIDADADHLHSARETFSSAGLRSSQTRLITGRAEAVLPRLTTSAYDLVFVDADVTHLAEHVEEGVRLLRTGGLLLINDALDHDRLPRPAVREESTRIRREVERTIREDQHLTSALLGAGTGLLVAVKSPQR